LLVDEPSIGLEPRFIDAVFEILGDLQHTEGKTIVMVEQNAKKGLEYADIGYVLLSGKLALAGRAKDLLNDPDVARLFLGGWLFFKKDLGWGRLVFSKFLRLGRGRRHGAGA